MKNLSTALSIALAVMNLILWVDADTTQMQTLALMNSIFFGIVALAINAKH